VSDNSAYDILMEPVRIGPVTAPNRFYQVPHCSGMGFAMPNSLVAMREVKAEGGWGVVCTEYCSTEPSSDAHPIPYCTIWDDTDQRVLSVTAEAIHRHGALAGIELWAGGYSSRNNLTRVPAVAPMSMPTRSTTQTRHMDRADIDAFRRNHRKAALRARAAGFDIVYVYAAHGNLPLQFLSPVQNQRSDEYGGSFENRARFLRELLEDTKEAIGDRCAVAVRFAVTTLDSNIGITHDGDGRALVELLAELPDLWDVNIGGYPSDARTARFAQEGAQEDYVSFVKTVTSKPVVVVGRYTSPDRMVSLIRKGIADLVGAARPSIADPFLPRKIAEGRIEDIRECIGCNICVMSDQLGAPIRCTQNPTMGEEWRRGWHPERVDRRFSVKLAQSVDGKCLPTQDQPELRRVLVVGAGPAGLEAARTLGQRGYDVVIAEAGTDLGGRAAREARLPGLATYKRVVDWRLTQISKMPNVEIYRNSRLEPEQILDFGFGHVCIATGARWRRNGVGRSNFNPFNGWRDEGVFTPDDIMDGHSISGRVLVYDDDHFYIGGVIAEALHAAGCSVVFATSADIVSPMCQWTLDQSRIQRRLNEFCAEIHTSHMLRAFEVGRAELSSTWTGETLKVACDAVIVITSREPNGALYEELSRNPKLTAEAGIATLSRVGDCDSPGLIAHAVYAGHQFARTLEGEDRVRRDRALILE
jgi:dimethylamine/trimethylamine dehydrogenase